MAEPKQFDWDKYNEDWKLEPWLGIAGLTGGAVANYLLWSGPLSKLSIGGGMLGLLVSGTVGSFLMAYNPQLFWKGIGLSTLAVPAALSYCAGYPCKNCGIGC